MPPSFIGTKTYRQHLCLLFVCAYSLLNQMQTHVACSSPTTVAVGLCSGLAGGVLACCTLAALKQPITLLLKLQPEVLHEATPYWWIRVAITPLVLLNMTLSGILQVCHCCSTICPENGHSNGCITSIAWAWLCPHSRPEIATYSEPVSAFLMFLSCVYHVYSICTVCTMLQVSTCMKLVSYQHKTFF